MAQKDNHQQSTATTKVCTTGRFWDRAPENQWLARQNRVKIAQIRFESAKSS
jgi:hypothetical protein